MYNWSRVSGPFLEIKSQFQMSCERGHLEIAHRLYHESCHIEIFREYILTNKAMTKKWAAMDRASKTIKNFVWLWIFHPAQPWAERLQKRRVQEDLEACGFDGVVDGLF